MSSTFFSSSFDAKLSRDVRAIVGSILNQPKGVCDARGVRIKLTQCQIDVVAEALDHAAHRAAAFAIDGPLPNRVKGVGRPPDNSYSLLIRDIMETCERTGLSTGRRYVAGSESLSVELFIALEKLLWPTSQASRSQASRSPRKYFDRWAKYPISRLNSTS
jgi:hypothetical protein